MAKLLEFIIEDIAFPPLHFFSSWHSSFQNIILILKICVSYIMLGTKRAVSRANWNHQRILYLIGLLKQHDLPRFRTDNAWSKDAWISMVGQFNSKFSLAFTVGQVKQKEQDLKKDFRAVKGLQEESGFGWDSSRMMVTAPESVWMGLEER
jgi:hypothetical protein